MSKKYDIICIGAALVDMVAKVERHPLEDDEVFVSDLSLFSGGAAANTAFACASLGLKSAFLGKLGKNDTFGLKIIDDFKKGNVIIDLIKYSDEHGTGSAYVALNDKADRRIYAHSGAANYLSEKDIILNEINQSKVIYLSSLKNIKPFIEAGMIGKKNGIPVILNPGMLIIDQGYDKISSLLGEIDVLILSQREYTTLMKIESIELEHTIVKQTSTKLFELGLKILIITLGSRGAFILSENKIDLIPTIEIENIKDTTGAGDAFSAGFIYGFVQSLRYGFTNLKKNVKIGNYIAGKCIQELGARNGIPNEEQLKSFLNTLK
ncbi:MAG: carbohydrate kinase family protein [Promethearchaeota archaeon]